MDIDAVVYEPISRGGIAHVTIGSCRYISRDQISAFIETTLIIPVVPQMSEASDRTRNRRFRRSKVLALSWDDGGSEPVVVTRLCDGTNERRPSAL